MNKVVKCKNGKCVQHFMHTEKNTKCPFCRTEYSEVGVRPESDFDTNSEKKIQETTSIRKGAFKIKIAKNNDS